MSAVKYILLDAANTLIHKPELWQRFMDVLTKHGYNVNEKELRYKHKLLSEYIKFPDVTSETFYKQFNKELLNSLGIIDSPNLLSDIFFACKNLPWQAFDDTEALKNPTCSLGVLSNFNSGLNKLLAEKLPEISFKNVFISEDIGISKPDIRFFKHSIDKIGLKPEEILYIGDSLKLDVIPAQSVGLQVKLIDREKMYPASPYSIQSLNNIS